MGSQVVRLIFFLFLHKSVQSNFNGSKIFGAMGICSRHGWYEQLRVTQQIDNVKTTSIQCRIDVVSLLCAYWLEAMLDQDRCICKQCRCRWVVTFFMLNSAEHEIFYANKSQITDNDQDRFMYLQTVQMQMDRYIFHAHLSWAWNFSC